MINRSQFQGDVLTWYDTHQRVLPWRENKDPYLIWISEIMLQQTRVNAVIPYFNRFVKVLPTIKDLALIPEDQLLKLWEGLGYYSRARNLKKAAERVIHNYDGVFPSDQTIMETLPGIGPYTSGAVASIAFNKRVSAVDGNVLRIFTRLLELRTTIKDKDTKKLIKDTVSYLLPKERVGDFNQGLMEIGATICLPNGAPLCEVCPLKSQCLAYRNNTMNEIPLKQQKKVVPSENHTVFLLEYNGKYAIEKRPNQGLLASMYQFPNSIGHISEKEMKELFSESLKITKLPNSKHKFSHKEWNMIGYHVVLKNESDYMFYTIEDIQSKFSIPSAFKTYTNELIHKQKRSLL